MIQTTPCSPATGRGFLWATIALLVLGLAACGNGGGPASEPGGPRPDLSALLCDWEEYPGNPILTPPPLDWIIGDPTVVLPEDSPDGKWHLFANSAWQGIYHHLSDDGIHWQRLFPPLFGPGSWRAWIHVEDGMYYMAYERFSDIGTHSTLQLRTSSDLYDWSAPTQILEPTLPWEKGPLYTTSCPCIVKRDGRYWLYYSTNGVYLEDCGFYEPEHIGLAVAEDIFGPYEKHPEPILSPSPDQPFRNYGAGAFKMFPEKVDGFWVAMNNGIYIDNQGRSRSAISVLSSLDGLNWERVCPGPVITPGGEGWDHALVYAMCPVRAGEDIRVYYNARDGWENGLERIGLATLRLPHASAGLTHRSSLSSSGGVNRAATSR